MSSLDKSNKGFSLTAVLLIILGLIFLLNNFGILSWNLWQELWKFWPVLLILFGVEIILGRKASFKSVGLLLVLIFIVPVVLIINPLTGNPLATKELSFQKPLGSLTKASFAFNLPSSNLKINALDGSSTAVFSGNLKYSQILPEPKLSEERHFGEIKYNLVQEDKKQIPFSNNIGNSGSFSFTSLIPLELSFASNTAVLDINLKNLKASMVDVESTAGSITINFASDFSTKTLLNTQAALIKLTIPKENGVSLKIESKFKNLKIDNNRFKKIDDRNFRSNNFDQSSVKIEVEISGSTSNIEID